MLGAAGLGPTAGLSSSVSTAPAASPGTARAQGRVSTKEGDKVTDLPEKQSTGWVTGTLSALPACSKSSSCLTQTPLGATAIASILRQN